MHRALWGFTRASEVYVIKSSFNFACVWLGIVDKMSKQTRQRHVWVNCDSAGKHLSRALCQEVHARRADHQYLYAWKFDHCRNTTIKWARRKSQVELIEVEDQVNGTEVEGWVNGS